MTQEERDKIVECEIQACGIDKRNKLDEFPHSFTPGQKEYVQLLCEEAFIEGRDSGLSRAKEILETAFTRIDEGI